SWVIFPGYISHLGAGPTLAGKLVPSPNMFSNPREESLNLGLMKKKISSSKRPMAKALRRSNLYAGSGLFHC
ncbi:hypothetical protein KGY79_09525, partial [Candidatus Bipolaricaulota bacterium]|nr:hypothetical protein [Candidatus Bipolaricaulota bacterium]